MEVRGTIKSWDDDKGFGFIRPQAAGEQVFAHISAMRGDRRPVAGDEVFFIANKDSQGRLRAEHIRLAGELSLDQPSIRIKPRATGKVAPATGAAKKTPKRATAQSKRRNLSAPIQSVGFKFVVFALLCVLPVWAALQFWLSLSVVWLMLVYPLMSIVSFMQYWRDKANAMSGEWRTPENSLHLVELLGGWPGALVAQQCFRHKTRKASYQLVFWLIIIAHQLFWFDWLLLDGTYVGGAIRGVLARL